AHLCALREIFVEGTLRHFLQQPSSMFPVGEWVRNTCAWTGAAPAEALYLLRGSHPGSADCLHALDLLDEYQDRIITGFDIIDLTLRELPQLNLKNLNLMSERRPDSEIEARDCEVKLRARVPEEHRRAFDDGLAEARTAYGLHDEDVRITYLWPLGLIRRAVLAAACQLIDRGKL